MDRNLLLAFALSFAVLLVWSSLVEPQPATAPQEQAAPAETPSADDAALPELWPAGEPEPLAVAGAEAPAPTTPSRTLTIETPLFEADLDSRGAGLTRFELKEFHASEREGGAPIQLITGRAPYGTALITPFSELGLEPRNLGVAAFEVVRQSSDAVTFRYENAGITVVKDYRFDPDSYAFELEVSVSNAGQRDVDPSFPLMWPVANVDGNDFREQSVAALVEGSLEFELVAGIGSGGWFSSDWREKPVEGVGAEWAGMQTPYFLAAMVPDVPAQAKALFIAAKPNEAGFAALRFAPVRLAPGQSSSRVFTIYAGPKIEEQLAAVGPGLVDSIDLGWSWVKPLTRFFNWLLAALHVFIPNYGWAIIVLTILVRLVTAPLTTKQMKSMERMRALQPKLTELKEKYGDDQQKQSEEMMKLYRQEGVNPLGGCLPMLLQLPVFIGLFYALRSSIALRQAPFIAWIDDLSAPEALFEIPGLGLPLRVLPLVMGGSMLLQQKITPMQTMDPAQQKMMTIMMPIMMTVLFYQFPSGLVLYWMVSNFLGIAHQLWIGRHLRT